MYLHVFNVISLSYLYSLIQLILLNLSKILNSHCTLVVTTSTVLCKGLAVQWHVNIGMCVQTSCALMSHLEHTWTGPWDWRHSETSLGWAADPHSNGCKSLRLHSQSVRRSPSQVGRTHWGNQWGWPGWSLRSKRYLSKYERRNIVWALQ